MTRREPSVHPARRPASPPASPIPGTLALAAAALSAFIPFTARAEVIWNEQIDGDFSDDRFNPTPLALAPGDNSLFGRLEGLDDLGNFDRDYYRMTIPAGHVLSQIFLETYLSTDFSAFMGVQPGPVFPDDPDTVAPEDLLGWTLFGPQSQGTDLLPQIGANGMGFTPPLSAPGGGGVFTFWVQQIGTFTEYAPIFVVEPIPTPAAAVVLGLSACGAMSRRRRRRAGR